MYVVCIAVLDVAVRAIQRTRDQSWAIAVTGSVAGALIFALTANFGVASFSPSLAGLFLLSGILWSLMVYFDFRALAFADAVSNEVLGSIRTILLAAAGWIWFEEVLSGYELLGAGLIFLGVAFAIPWIQYKQPQGLLLRVLSVVTGVAAILVDKKLVQLSNVGLVVLSGYLIPSFLYLLVRPFDWRKQIAAAGTNPFLFVLVIILYIAIGPLLVTAFGNGELGGTFFIAQSRVALVFILAFLLLGEREWFWGKLLGTVLCMTGLSVFLWK